VIQAFLIATLLVFGREFALVSSSRKFIPRIGIAQHRAASRSIAQHCSASA
jgi:hypothetical protein